MSTLFIASLLPLSALATPSGTAAEAIDRAVTTTATQACLADAAEQPFTGTATYTLTFAFDGDGVGQLAAVAASAPTSGPAVGTISACLAHEVIHDPRRAHESVERMLIVQPACGPGGIALTTQDPDQASRVHPEPDAFTCVDTCIAAWSESGVLDQLDLELRLSYDAQRRVASVSPRHRDLDPELDGVLACVEDAMVGRASPRGHQPREWTLSAWRTVAVSWADAAVAQ